jgi:hypothetical protein
MIAGQAAYEAANGGFFEGDPTCLAEPARCIPGYAQDAPTFLDRSLASAEVNKGGYRRVFHAGPPAGPDAIQTKRSSRSSVRSYAYTAVPQAPGPDRPGYCGDASGVVCATRDGSPPLVVDGACVVAQSEEGRGLTETSPPKGCRVLGY